MANGASSTFIGKEFDDFLYAPIGEDTNGMRLCVVSALARLDLDPWSEAAALARLPGEAAIQRLAALIAALPDQLTADRDSSTIAARVIALLPRRANPSMPARSGLPGLSRFHPLLYAFLIILTVFFAAELLGAGFH